MANSNKTFLTIIFSIFFGINSESLSVVIQAEAFVLIAKDLYLILSKKVKSFFCANCNDLISLTVKLFLNLFLEKK